MSDEALVVRPKRACALLNVGVTRLYELIAQQELVSYKTGTDRRAARWITTASIHGYVERQIERARAESQAA
jgi:excisionase family DNA binding protein